MMTDEKRFTLENRLRAYWLAQARLREIELAHLERFVRADLTERISTRSRGRRRPVGGVYPYRGSR